MTTSVRVVEIGAADTHDLRRRVLRDGTPSHEVDWPGDHDPTTVHLGVRAPTTTADGPAGRLVAVSTWLLAVAPWRHDEGADGSGVQLRGMATDPATAFRGQGLGSLLLRRGIERAWSDGRTHVWANARVPVLDFYVAHGFTVVGDVVDSAETGIPHRRIVLDRPAG